MKPHRIANPKELKRFSEELTREQSAKRMVITVSGGTCGFARGSSEVADALREELKSSHLDQQIEVKVTGCLGFCEREPIVLIHPERTFYVQVKPANAKLIVNQTVKDGQLVSKLLYKDPVSKKVAHTMEEVPFYFKQMRLLFAHSEHIDPLKIEDYITVGGYQALAQALYKMTPEQVIDEITKSGLRGRGGGGFPAGRKWATCRRAKGEPKYVICNADEGDPGAFMDRSLLEGNPHSVIEGMIIGAFAIESHIGFVYVRNEYPLAVKNLNIAIKAARQYGLLGDDILSSGFSFDIEVSRGGGAFVCGESTALMASLEGKIGEPRAKYIHTVEAGLWDKPSNLNNVETWANVPLIIEKGAEWYTSIGTENSKGTKVFAITGKVSNTGLVEVPMGITLREILYDIGGGLPKGKKFKAVQTGGPSGGTLIVETAEPDIHRSMVEHGDLGEEDEAVNLLDLPVDFDELTKAGSMMGSGGMIVMDQDSCMVDVARYFLNFLQEESCGKCLPCREGLRIMLDIVNRICDGKGELEDIDMLEELAQVMIDTSLCQLGGSAPNPVLSTIRYFRREYLAHIIEKTCPAGVCKELVSHAIDETCTGCQLCLKSCPTNAITGGAKQLHIIDQSKCIQCGACHQVCNIGSVKRVKRGDGDKVQRIAKEKWIPVAQRKKAAVA